MVESTKKIFVVDASFVVAFLLPDEKSAEPESIFDQYAAGNLALFTTTLLPYEVLNVFRSAVVRKRFTKQQAMDFYEAFSQLGIPEEPVDFPACLQLAVERNISCYDASYLVLARQKKATLLTFDKALQAVK